MQDLTAIRQELVLIVKSAGENLEQFRKKGFSAHSKGGVDFATEADDATDAFLRKSLSEKFPDTLFLTEETAPSDYSSFKERENVWIIDPIDGTTNFSRGSSYFAISVGLVDKGRTKLGVVYLPFEQKLYWAQQDKNEAYLNDSPIHVSSTGLLRETLVSCGWSWSMEKRRKTHEKLGKVLSSVRAIECRGSAAADIASLASGSIDAYFICGVFPWDIAAALLIAEKAGALIKSLDGKELSVFTPDLLVTNGKIDAELLSYLT